MIPGWLQPLAEAAPGAISPSTYRPPAEGGRPSAVLVLFGEGPRGPDVLLIERSADLRDHAGQPAFPGGGVDPGDPGPVAAALREAAEETGLDPGGVEIFATMPELYISRSGFVVTPVLAWWREPCEVAPVDPGEIAAVARVPVDDLTDPANRLRVRHPRGFLGPAFRVSNMLVWGFTAGLLDRLLRLGGWERPWDASRVENLPPESYDLATR
ncbi:MAG: NUDIX domain-containing protein [Streptosporangiales bacterium]|nr:NUDIX domain-containing protein [Streptosporangiales bacterium]